LPKNTIKIKKDDKLINTNFLVKMEENVPKTLEEALLRIAQLEKETAKSKIDMEKKKQQLEKANAKNKKYYKTHREEYIQKVKEYQEKTNYYKNIPPEKKKEYARTAYLNKKEKERKKKEAEEKEKEELIPLKN
jgi:hypothetical protein